MRLLAKLWLGTCVGALAQVSAHAFTIDGKDGSSDGMAPKFDIEEQAKQFRQGGTAAKPGTSREIDTPFGKGTLYFGVDQQPASGFGPSFAPNFGPRFNSDTTFGSKATPRDMDRMLAPPGLQHRYDN